MTVDFLIWDDLEDVYEHLDGGFFNEDKHFLPDLDEVTTEVSAYEDSSRTFSCKECHNMVSHKTYQHKAGKFASTKQNFSRVF